MPRNPSSTDRPPDDPAPNRLRSPHLRTRLFLLLTNLCSISMPRTKSTNPARVPSPHSSLQATPEKPVQLESPPTAASSNSNGLYTVVPKSQETLPLYMPPAHEFSLPPSVADEDFDDDDADEMVADAIEGDDTDSDENEVERNVKMPPCVFFLLSVSSPDIRVVAHTPVSARTSPARLRARTSRPARLRARLRSLARLRARTSLASSGRRT